MTEIENSNEEYVAVSLEYGPGQTLADSRESKGLSIQDVATQLNVTEDIINGLERDEYNNLPPAIYTRGYLRSYANLLGIDPEPLLERHKKLTSASDKEIKASPKIQAANSRTIIKKKKYKRKKDSSSSLFIVFLIIVLVAICYGIWSFLSGEVTIYPTSNTDISVGQSDDSAQETNIEIDETVYEVESNEDSSIKIPAEDQPAKIVLPGQQSGSEPTIISPDQQSQTMSLSIPNGNDAVDAINQGAVELPEASSDSSIIEQNQEKKAEASQQELAQAEDANETLGEAVINTSEKDNVRLILAADSYVEIKDSTGKKFFFTVIPGSSTKTIQGKRPFEVKLGNAGAVQIEFNGQNYNFGNFDLGEVAKFQLK